MSAETKHYNAKELGKDELIQQLTRHRPNPFLGSEKQYQQYVVDNLPELCKGLGLPHILKIEEQRQFTNDLDKCLPDLFVTHIDYTISVFEIKRFRKHLGASDQIKAIGQLLHYGISLEVKLGVRPELFLIDSQITPQVLAVCKHSKLDINLIELTMEGYVLAPYCKRYGKVEAEIE